MLASGSLIKKLRTEAGLTQKRLAELAGVSQAHIAKIEAELVDPRLSTVNRILRVLAIGNKKKCRDIMTKGVFSARPDDTISTVSDVLIRYAISQMPVVHGKKILGTVTEETIIRNLRSNLSAEKVRNVMEKALPMVDEETNADTIISVLEKHPGVLVMRRNVLTGIITRSDLIKTIA